MRLVLLAVVGWLSSCLPTHSLEATFGDCSPIVNLDFSNPEAVTKYLTDNKIVVEDAQVQLILDIGRCGPLITDSTARLNALIFALDQMLIVKRKWYIPALDKYIKYPTTENFDTMTIMGRRNLKRIEDSIDALVAYEASLKQFADADPIDRQTQKLNQLGQNLDARLTAKLRSPVDIFGRIPSRQNQAATLDAMKQYRKAYIAIINDIEKTVEEMRAYAKKQPG